MVIFDSCRESREYISSFFYTIFGHGEPTLQRPEPSQHIEMDVGNYVFEPRSTFSLGSVVAGIETRHKLPNWRTGKLHCEKWVDSSCTPIFFFLILLQQRGTPNWDEYLRVTVIESHVTADALFFSEENQARGGDPLRYWVTFFSAWFSKNCFKLFILIKHYMVFIFKRKTLRERATDMSIVLARKSTTTAPHWLASLSQHPVAL